MAEKLMALVVGDLHCHPHGGDWSRVDDALAAFRWALRVYDERGCNHLFFLGDWMHNKRQIPTAVCDLSRTLVEEAAAAGVRISFVPGNHDEPDGGDPRHAFGWVPSTAAHVVGKPAVYRYEDHLVYAVPHYAPIDKMRDVIDRVIAGREDAEGRRTVFLGHLDLVGGRQSGSHVSEYGVPPTLLRDSFDLSLLGHYHVRDELLPGVLYVGSLLTTRHNEEGPRGVHVLCADGIEFVPNDASPRHLTLWPEQIADNPRIAEGNIVRVRSRPGDDPRELDKLAKAAGARRSQVLPAVEDSAEDGAMYLPEDSAELTTDDILRRWVEQCCPPGLDPRVLFETGAEILSLAVPRAGKAQE